jgi:hypothetical protein
MQVQVLLLTRYKIALDENRFAYFFIPYRPINLSEIMSSACGLLGYRLCVSTLVLRILPLLTSIVALSPISFQCQQRHLSVKESPSLPMVSWAKLSRPQPRLRRFYAEAEDDVIMDMDDDNDDAEKRLLLQEIQELTNTFLQVQDNIKANSVLFQQSLDDYEQRLQEAQLLLKSQADQWAKDGETLRRELQSEQSQLEVVSRLLQEKEQEIKELTKINKACWTNKSNEKWPKMGRQRVVSHY